MREIVINSNPLSCCMLQKGLYIKAVIVFSFFLMCTVPVVAQEAPYSFTVSPVSAEGKPGDTITYYISITADPGFKSPVDFTLDVSSMGYSKNFVLGTYEGPYPRSSTYVLTIPKNVPTGVTADVTINGRSGGYLQQQSLKLKIKGSGGPIEDITSMITDLINTALKEIARLTGGK
jgi:hypothetical protein